MFSNISSETKEALLKEIHDLLCQYCDLPSPPWISEDPVQGAYARLSSYLLARRNVAQGAHRSYEIHERMYTEDPEFMAFVDVVIPKIWNDILNLGSSPISDTDDPTTFRNNVQAAFEYIRHHPDLYPLGSQER